MRQSVDITTQPEPPAEWESLARARGLFYHHPRWMTGLAQVFWFEMSVIVARDGAGGDRGGRGAGELCGGLALAQVPGLIGPRRLVSFPFSYAAGVLATSEPVATALAAEAIRLAQRKGAKRVELKHVGTERPASPGFARVVRYHTYRLSLSGGESAIWKRLQGSSTQRGIRKAERAGVRVVVGDSVRDWTAMAVLEEGTARGHGVPAPPRRFFVDFCRGLQQDGLAELYLAEVPGKGGIAAGIVVWRGWREWIYAFGASRREALEHRPNHALLWAAVRGAAAAGVEHFDLGRAAPEQVGLVEFKRRWGGEPVPLAYDYWPRPAGLNVGVRHGGTLGLAARVWAHLPARVARWGSALYRYLG